MYDPSRYFVDAITQDEILIKELHLIDHNDDSTNYILKPGLIEGVDYLVVTPEIWNFFFLRYRGVPIVRFRVMKDNREYIEVNL